MSRQFARCFGVARSSRGNQASGAETRRPSTSVTINSSSVHLTSTASATGLLAKVLIPRNDKLVAMFFNDRIKFAQFRAAESAGFDQTQSDRARISGTAPLALRGCGAVRDLNRRGIFRALPKDSR